MQHAKSKNKRSITFRDLLIISRPFWWVNTAMPFVASYFIINGRTDWLLFFGAVYFAFIYNLLMYGVNDIFDYESDIKNPRKIAAGIEGSVFPKQKHPILWFWIIIISLPSSFVLLANGTLTSNLWLAIMLFMVLAYSVKGLRFKEVPFLDSITSSFHYTSPFIYGGLLVGASQLYAPAFVIFFIWVMANHAFGAIQDITPDRKAGINSIATKLGASRTIWFVLIAYITAAIVPIGIYGTKGLLVSLLLSPYIVLVARTLPHRNDDTSPAFRHAWQQFLYVNYAVGFVLTMVLLYSFNRIG